jgi:hypothetical protein
VTAVTYWSFSRTPNNDHTVIKKLPPILSASLSYRC